MSNTLVSVAFDGDTLDLINHHDEPFVACKPVAVALGLDWSSQRQRLDAYRDRWGVVEITIPSAGGRQRSLTLPLRKLPAWLYSIKPGKVAEHVRPKLERYQAECDEVLWRHWSGRAAPAPTAPATAPTTTETRLDRIEAGLDRMADNMGELVRVSLQQATKLEVTSRYIGLLELNQRGKVKVTPEIERTCLELYAQGMSQSDIGRLCRISHTSVNLIIKGKYPRNALTRGTTPPAALVQAALERNLEEERQRLLTQTAQRQIAGGVQ